MFIIACAGKNDKNRKNTRDFIGIFEIRLLTDNNKRGNIIV